jgi:pilus assembly protein CpaC
MMSFALGAKIDNRILQQKEFEQNTIFLVANSFRVLQFEQMIRKVQLTNSDNLTAEFLERRSEPLTRIKIFAKKASNENALITFYDGKTLQISFNIVQDIKDIIALLNTKYPNLIVQQINDNIVLQGHIQTQKDKKKVLDIFKKASVDVDKKVIDMIKVIKPSKMVRVKLYAVEINNDKGLTLKNNWMLSRKNYINTTDPTTKVETNVPQGSDSISKVNNQRNFALEDALDGIMTSAVTLTGGLTGTANYLGKHFNAGLTLNYLASEGVANILDETTLITLEKDKSKFHAGGTIYLKAQSSTAEGLPTTEIKPINYGLQLEISAKNVIDGEYVHLNLTTKSTQIDWVNQVDGIPSFIDKSIDTTVIVQNQSTIVLGGLMKNSNSKDIDKIPLLGDIPVLGFLFRSKAFKEGKSELVFFITPEIVDPMKNNQREMLTFKEKKMKELKADGDTLYPKKEEPKK